MLSCIKWRTHNYFRVPNITIFFIFINRSKCDVKSRIAKAIINEFPTLKDDEGQGFVSIHVYIIIICWLVMLAVTEGCFSPLAECSTCPIIEDN